MKSSNTPANSVHSQLEMHLRAIKNLMAQLEPSERSAFISEAIMSMLPTRSGKPSSTADKLERKKTSSLNLSPEDQQLILEMDRKTAALFETLSGKNRN